MVGYKKQGSGITALADDSDIYYLMIGAAGVGKIANFLYPNIEYACASGMSFVTTDTKGDLFHNYAGIAKEHYGYQILPGREGSSIRPRRRKGSTATCPGGCRFGQTKGADRGYFSEIYEKELPHRTKTVYMYLKDRRNKEGQCYPAIGTVVKELQLSRRTVERAIDDLISGRTHHEGAALAGERRQE